MAAVPGTSQSGEFGGTAADPIDLTSITVDTGADIFVCMLTDAENAGPAIATPTITLDPTGANQALTERFNAQQSFLARFQLHDRDSPTPGTVTLRIDRTGTNALRGGWATLNLSNVDTGTPRGTQASAGGTGTTVSLDPASDDANDITVGGVSVNRGDHDPVQATGVNIAQGEDADNTANDNHASYSFGYILGTSALTFNWTSTGENTYTAGAQSYNGLAGGSTTPLTVNLTDSLNRGVERRP